MQDPTRIDKTLAALRDAWEGQPDLELGTIVAMLANQGIGWGSPDEQTRSALEAMAYTHPPLLPIDDSGRVEGRWLLVGEKQRVTIDDSHVIVRRPGPNGQRQPVVWKYSSLRPTGPGRTLVITDAEGFEHRLGVVRSLTRLADAGSPEGLRKKAMGDLAFIIRVDDGLFLLDHRLHYFCQLRRELVHEEYAWERIEQCRPGADLVFALKGGDKRTFAAVEDVLVAEAAPATR
ncbi:hypothetical protein VVR26_04815 [Corynebacterium camporealensis]|uniref:hypothetical protein n=1 Tax=Corynebacterium camporealensis TaxID=161896 RepID=UPI0034CE678E